MSQEVASQSAAAPKRRRGPSKKTRELLAAEYRRGWNDGNWNGSGEPDRSHEMLGLVLWMVIFGSAGCVIGAWLF